jgi:YesN/AraC family two-component response regulator
MIRQGLRVMIQRSGVPVENILECSNGLKALEILEQQKVDVMFTDIRMPQMGGLELVGKVHAMGQEPLMVAVSGYDDFSYAVEMLRHGVKEYLLKPVERERLRAILEKLEEELGKKQSRDLADRAFWLRQLQYDLLDQITLSGDDWTAMHRQEPDFLSDGYVVCCMENQEGEFYTGEDHLFIPGLGDLELHCIKEDRLRESRKSKWAGHTVGVSRVKASLESLKEGWEEAVLARKCAFWKREDIWYYEIPDDLPESTKVFGSAKGTAKNKPNVLSSCAQLFGAGRSQAAIRQVSNFMANTAHSITSRHMGVYDTHPLTSRQIEEEDKICQELTEFWDQMKETYKSILSEEDAIQIEKFQHPYRFPTAAEYEKQILDFLGVFADMMENQYKDYPNKQKIRQALNYIQEHYDTNLNMAKVSNEISMSYTVFSLEFKQYTGCNFVDYIKELRMQKAKQLLEQTDLLILEICKKVGYEDEKHFMKMFKAVYGISPTEYRRNTGFRK